jgi:hypothetical protein
MRYTGTQGIVLHGDQKIANISEFEVLEGDEPSGQISVDMSGNGHEIKDVFQITGTAVIDIEIPVGVLSRFQFNIGERTLYAEGFITGQDHDTITFEGAAH